MAIASTLSPKLDSPTAASTGSTRQYNLTGYPGLGKSARLEITSTPQAPKTLEITARTEKGASNQPKRHVRIITGRDVKVNATYGPLECSATITLRMPDTADFSTAEATALLYAVENALLGSGVTDAWVRGEV